MSYRHTWYVWDAEGHALIVGGRAKCLAYYRKHGGTKAGLTLGYCVD